MKAVIISSVSADVTAALERFGSGGMIVTFAEEPKPDIDRIVADHYARQPIQPMVPTKQWKHHETQNQDPQT